MARIQGEIVIRRPVEEVFDFVADERNEPRYNARMASATLITDPPVGPGSRFTAQLETRGRTLPMTVEFTEFDRPRRLASSTHSSMMDTVGALSFTPEGGGTRMSWSWDVRPRGALRLVPSLVGMIGRRQEQRIWGNLKRLLEAGPPQTSDDPTRALPRSKVLIAYATRQGSTKGVAERIAARLRERGADVDLRPLDQDIDLGPYDAVVLGSPVYTQQWLPSATAFAQRSADALATRQVWLFSVGSFGDTHRVIGKAMRQEPKGIGAIERAIHPCDYRVFAGAIERHQWPLASRLFFHAFGGRFGENRDWGQIDSWADTIAGSLVASAAVAAAARD